MRLQQSSSETSWKPIVATATEPLAYAILGPRDVYERRGSSLTKARSYKPEKFYKVGRDGWPNYITLGKPCKVGEVERAEAI